MSPGWPQRRLGLCVLAPTYQSPTYNVSAMMRLRAVRSLLVEEVAGIPGTRSRRWSRRASEDEPRDDLRDDPEAETVSLLEQEAFLRAELDRVSRKALGMVVLCWTAILVLLLTHESPERFLSFEGIELVFTVGILVVASYSGFRLGQWEKYRAVTRVVKELEEREGE